MDTIQTTPPKLQFSLSPEELAQFHERGYAGPFKLYEPDEIKATWRRQRLKLMDRSHAAYEMDSMSGNTNIANYDRHLDNEFLADHIGRAEIVHRAVSILGNDVNMWRSEFFSKYPGEEGTDWHQADTFAMASGRNQLEWPSHVQDAVRGGPFGGALTVWSAFTEADEEMGALQFIPGTHKSMFYDETGGMQYDPNRINSLVKDGVKRGFWGYDYRSLQKDPNWAPDESQAVSVPCRAGEFIIFWSTLMHASHPHAGKSKEYRMAYASRYIPSSVRIYPDTDFLEEYGGKVTLDKYGAVNVAGKTDPAAGNKIATHTLGGKAFAHYDT
jgi:non-heme Fe2+,alpha-ketoglutarate-dependent halogenase